MKRLPYLLLTLVAPFLMGAEIPQKPPSPDEQTVAALKAVGAEASRDDKGRVVGVTFRENPKFTEDALALLAKLPDLKSLSLADTPTTDAGLAHIENLTGLEFLTLTKTKVTDAGLAHLKKLTQLQVLNISGTEVTGTGLAHLAGAKNLGFLYAGGSRFSDAGMPI